MRSIPHLTLINENPTHTIHHIYYSPANSRTMRYIVAPKKRKTAISKAHQSTTHRQAQQRYTTKLPYTS